MCLCYSSFWGCVVTLTSIIIYQPLYVNKIEPPYHTSREAMPHLIRNALDMHRRLQRLWRTWALFLREMVESLTLRWKQYKLRDKSVSSTRNSVDVELLKNWCPNSSIMLNFQETLVKLLVVAIWFANADSKGKKVHKLHT